MTEQRAALRGAGLRVTAPRVAVLGALVGQARGGGHVVRRGCGRMQDADRAAGPGATDSTAPPLHRPSTTPEENR